MTRASIREGRAAASTVKQFDVFNLHPHNHLSGDISPNFLLDLNNNRIIDLSEFFYVG